MAHNASKIIGRPLIVIFFIFLIIGSITFVVQVTGDQPEEAWQTYLINFLLFSAMAQGGFLFSVMMNTVKAKWSFPLSTVSEAFAAFFPISLVLFLILFGGSAYVFPWLHKDLHGKEVWLNLPFLFVRDFIGTLMLYLLGFAYLYHALWFKLPSGSEHSRFQRLLAHHWIKHPPVSEQYQNRKRICGNLYILAFALVLSLIGFDLVMSMDPNWSSTLFGAYTFIQSFYTGLAAVIIIAAVLHLHPQVNFMVLPSQFHDIGKLLFAFCMVWGDFFYVQLVVIWYGNIPEETAYIIRRTIIPPWNSLAWAVFLFGFVIPFLILINKKIKTIPGAMIILCLTIIISLWLEHLLLLGPTFFPYATHFPLKLTDGLISIGFVGLMGGSLTVFFNQFPELINRQSAETIEWKR